MNCRTAAMLALLAAAIASAAEWRMADEQYSCYTSGMTLQELASGGVTVLSHTPPTAEYCAEAHRWGLKVCPYVSLYKVVDSTKDPSVLDDPFWREVDAAKHPEWFLRRDDGGIRRPFDLEKYPAGYEQSCCNHRDLVDAYVRGVRNVMALGADGVFVDNVHPHPTCYGPARNLHRHEWPEKDNTACYQTALRAVYEAVKSYGPDRVVILNPGGLDPRFADYGDAMMWESFVWRFGADGLFIPADIGPPEQACRTHSWSEVLEQSRRWQPLIGKGASIAPLTYLPDRTTEERNAFFSYACARISGFEQWTATCNHRRDILRRLYRVRPGQPLGDLSQAGSAVYRHFENALIVCNPTPTALTERIPVPPGLVPPLVELFDGREATVREGLADVALPPEAGRVVVPQRAAVENALREVEGQATAALLHLQDEDDGPPQVPETGRLVTALEGVRSRAAELRGRLREAGPLPADLGPALCALSLGLPQAGDLPPPEALESHLLQDARTLTRDGVLGLLARRRLTAPRTVVRPDGVTVAAAGTTVRLAPAERTLGSIGRMRLELWVTPKPEHRPARWLHAQRLEDVRLAVDAPDRKRVEGRMALGDVGQPPVRDLVAEFAIEAGKEAPTVAIEVRIVNSGGPYTCYAFLAVGMPWQTDPTLGTVAASDAPDHRQVAWAYLHSAKEGGGGVVLTRLPALGKSGNASYVFGLPREQPLAKGGAFDLSLAAAAVPPPASSDPFLAERLENLARHAGLAAGIASGLSLQCTVTGGEPVAGEPVEVSLTAVGPTAPAVVASTITLAAALEGKDLGPTGPHEAEASGARFDVRLPATAKVLAGLDLAGSAEVTLRDGRRLALRTLSASPVREPIEVAALSCRPGPAPEALTAAVRLRSRLGRAASGTASLSLPGGWGAPAPQTWALSPAAEGEVSFALECPAGNLNALLEATLAVVPEGGAERRSPLRIKVSPTAAVPGGVSAPLLDGHLDEPCWQTAATLTPLVNHQDGKPVREPTVAYVAHDATRLYVGVRCHDSQVAELRAQAVPDARGYSAQAPQDDSVEVYVAPEPGTGRFCRFVVTCAGVRKSETEGPWQAIAAKAANEWTAELAIPYATLGAPPPRPGTVWGLNVCRNQQRLGETSCWSCTYGAFAQPERFGWACFR